MTYNINSIIEEVRILLNQNQVASTIRIFDDEIDDDQLTLDDIIRHCVVAAAKQVLMAAPASMIGEAKPYLRGVTSDDGNYFVWDGTLCRVKLPTDFLRIVSMKLRSWDIPIHEMIGIEDPRYLELRSEFEGVGGSAERPSAAIITTYDGMMAELYPCRHGDKFDYFMYVAEPDITIVGGQQRLQIDARLYHAMLYVTCGLVCTTISDQRAGNFMALARNYLGGAETKQQ